MQTKNRTAVVTEAAAQAALRKGPAPELAADEERAMRMRLGAPLPGHARLERKAAGDPELEIELLAYEIEAFMKWKEHLGRVRATARHGSARPAPAVATSSRTKEKIVRALRKKS